MLIGASLHSIYIVLVISTGGTGEGQQHSLKMRTRVSESKSSVIFLLEWNVEDDDKEEKRRRNEDMNGDALMW